MNSRKRAAVSDSTPENNTDSDSRNKRVMEGTPFSFLKAEPSQQQPMGAPSLDMKRAKSAEQHVRALNAQFASWVQDQMKNHPDELWEDGLRDYLAHAAQIMAKFSDVVSWLRVNSGKAESLSAAGSHTAANNLLPENKSNDVKSFQGKSGFKTGGQTPTFTNSWSSAASSNTVQNMLAPESKNNESKSFTGFTPSTNVTFGISWSSPAGSLTSQVKSGFNPVTTTSTFTAPWTSSGSSTNETKSITENKSNENTLFQGKTASTPGATTTSFATSWSPGLFGNSQATALPGGQNSALGNRDVSDDADGEEDVQQPSSPSVKKAEEEGILVVHEVKCKLYVKSTDPADKDTWKDKGTGKLAIKVKEGISKGTKESKPTIVIRNDVGKLLLNALLYPGIKTNAQKNSLVAIFHTSGDNGGENDSVVARTFLIRTKSEEERNKLATTIQDYAPSC